MFVLFVEFAPCAKRVSGVVAGAVVVVNFKLELIAAWIVMGDITSPGLHF